MAVADGAHVGSRAVGGQPEAGTSRRAGLDRSRGAVSLVVALVLLAVAAVVVGTGHARAVVDVLDGRTWLWSSEEGEMAAANGSSGRTEVRLRVGEDVVRVVQDGDRLLFLDADGVVSAVDLGSYAVRSSDYGDGQDLELVLGADVSYLVDVRQGSVQVLEAGSADPRGKALALGGPLAVGSVDDADHLWVGQETSGEVVAVGTGDDGAVADERVQVSQPGEQLSISVADGEPVVINADTAEAVRIDGADVGERFDLGIDPGTEVVVAPANEDGTVPVAVPDANALLLVRDDETHEIDLGDGEAELGPPLRFSGKSYVPDLGASVVLEVTDEGEITNRIDVPGGERGFELFHDDEHLWANAVDEPTARSIDQDGHVTIVEKYDPEVEVTDPGLDEDTPGPTEPDPGSPDQGDDPGPSGPALDPGPGPGPGGTTPVPTSAPPPTTAPAPPPPPPPPGVPGQPVAFTGSASDREIVLTWGVPPDGGSPITEYALSWRDDRGGSGERRVPVRSTAVTAGTASLRVAAGAAVDVPLTNGVGYTFRLAATNAVGTGPATEAGPITPTREIPSPPTDVTASERPDGTVALTWGAGDGEGFAVTGYEVVARPVGGDEVPLGEYGSPASIDGLDLGTSVEVGVRTVSGAVDGGARSDPAWSEPVVPYAPPASTGLSFQRSQDGPKLFLASASPGWQGRTGFVRLSGVVSAQRDAADDGSVAFDPIDPAWGTVGDVVAESCVLDDDGVEHCATPEVASLDARAPELAGSPYFRGLHCAEDPNRPGSGSIGRMYEVDQEVRTYGVPLRFFNGYGFRWTYWRGGNSGNAWTGDFGHWAGGGIGGDGLSRVHGGWGQDTDRYFLTAWVSVDGLGRIESQRQLETVVADCPEDGPGRGT
jgi:hypothetical protein